MLNKFSLVKKITKKENLFHLDQSIQERVSILEFAAFEMLLQVKQRTKPQKNKKL